MNATLDERTATISPDGRYRYDLTRRWADGPFVLWIMLNPSTADASVDDPTIRRCISFSKREGCGGLAVVNLFAFRATNPAELRRVGDPMGPENASTILGWLERPDIAVAVAAWGAWVERQSSSHTRFLRPNVEYLATVASRPLHCLGRTRGGSPRHPLRLRSDQPLEVWE
jgi:hypothetical protein